MTENSTIIIIPHYNHFKTISSVVEQLSAYSLPILIVDDGSDTSKHDLLRSLESEKVQVHFCSANKGKGAAVKVGFTLAHAQGYSHAIQVDADGQHRLDDIPKFLEASANTPQALICGQPVYSDDAPKARLYGRKITNFWNMVNTWSLDLRDGMCGFRLYPLQPMVELINNQSIGDRMDFDTEILVRSHWQQIPLVWLPTPVTYQSNEVSHFRGFKDNWLISKMHARLFFGMLQRVITGKKL
ncbi:glycosyl transferase [Psittacicella hinzii]|uniref:Glycosyl transferase n=1 Tax=Psittacicella hinzii TaxID=2028575 RepID=A0A3A1Y364_9GAMM|nr:glycosyltransferase family 2 protein [Psittacicella hinzii]RIY31648.1 glycosyl transferase [Psittacicella hinzii]